MARQICATCVGAAFGLLLLDLPTVASAQTLGSSTIRGFVSLNAGGAHPAVPSFSDVAVDVYGINRDEVRADYRVKNGKSLDVGGGVILGRGFLVGLAVSNSANKQPADLTLTLAHPQFHPTLTATTQTGALNHTETGVHIELGYALPQIKRVDVLVFAGPTHFSVSQPLVVDFVADETFDRTRRTYSAVVSDPITERKTGGAWGYHVGTDVSVRVTRLVGIGGLVRYSKATVGLDNPMESMLHNRTVTQDLNAGGWQMSGGVRLRF